MRHEATGEHVLEVEGGKQSHIDVGHPATLRGALGHRGTMILAHLLDNRDSLRVRDLAQGVGCSPDTVGRHINHGILSVFVERDEQRRVRIRPSFTVEMLDLVASEFGTAGIPSKIVNDIRARFIERKQLTPDGRWMNPWTGEIGERADWLIDPKIDENGHRSPAQALTEEGFQVLTGIAIGLAQIHGEIDKRRERERARRERVRDSKTCRRNEGT